MFGCIVVAKRFRHDNADSGFPRLLWKELIDGEKNKGFAFAVIFLELRKTESMHTLASAIPVKQEKKINSTTQQLCLVEFGLARKI